MEKDPDFTSPKRKCRKVELPPKKRFTTAVSDGNMAVMSKGYVPQNRAKGCLRLYWKMLLRLGWTGIEEPWSIKFYLGC